MYESLHLYMHVFQHIYMNLYVCTYMWIDVSHWGGLQTIKSFVCALGVYIQMTESTINSTFCIFIEQLSNSDMQKMVIQFAIQFTPNTVYTLNNKIKHLVHQFNAYSEQSLCIPSQIEYIQ